MEASNCCIGAAPVLKTVSVPWIIPTETICEPCIKSSQSSPDDQNNKLANSLNSVTLNSHKDLNQDCTKEAGGNWKWPQTGNKHCSYTSPRVYHALSYQR